MEEEDYPLLAQIGVPIIRPTEDSGGVVHVLQKDLYPKLEKLELTRNDFSEAFGMQTCPYIEGENGEHLRAYYPWDVERAIRTALSKKTGMPFLSKDDSPVTGEYYFD